MTAIEGVFHNQQTGDDELIPLECDENGRLIVAAGGSVAQFPSSKEFVFNVGEVDVSQLSVTSSVDLGEGHPYTMLIARKNGIASQKESAQIESSIDGVNWLPAAGVHTNVAWYAPDGGSSYFVILGRPIGRFARIAFVNGVTPQTDLKFELVAITGA